MCSDIKEWQNHIDQFVSAPLSNREEVTKAYIHECTPESDMRQKDSNKHQRFRSPGN